MIATRINDETLCIEATLDSTPESVTETLRCVRRHLDSVRELACIDGTWEIVLAEVLNNIVEHAYTGVPRGPIELTLRFDGDILHASMIDDGLPMPNGAPPRGTIPDLDVPTSDLPEGGFGWALVHSLASRLEYQRSGAQNHLHLELPLCSAAS